MVPMPGPERMTLIITAGTCAAARLDIPSDLRLMPGLEEDVIAYAPVAPAP